jgi:hypothetical protein
MGDHLMDEYDECKCRIINLVMWWVLSGEIPEDSD